MAYGGFLDFRYFHRSAYFWTYLACAAFFVFGFCALTLHLVLRFALERYVHQFTFRRISWTLKLEDVEWEGKTVSNSRLKDSGALIEERTRVHVQSIGLAFRKGKDGKRWFGIRAYGVTVVMPRSHFARRLKPTAKRKPRRPSVADKIVIPRRVAHLLLGLFRLFNSSASLAKTKAEETAPDKLKTVLGTGSSVLCKIFKPAAQSLLAVFHSLTAFMRLAIRGDELSLEVRDLFTLTTSALVGVQLARREGAGHLTFFGGIDGFRLTPSSSLLEQQTQAISIADLMLLRAIIPYTAAVEVLQNIRSGQKAQRHQDYIAVKLEFFDGLQRKQHKHSKNDSPPVISLATLPLLTTIQAIQTAIAENQNETPMTPQQTPAPAQTPISLDFLKSADFEIPALHIIHHFGQSSAQDGSSHVLTSKLYDLKAMLTFGQTYTSGSTRLPPEHKGFIGKTQVVPIALEASFESIEAKIALDGQTDPRESQSFHIAESRLRISSTWLPSNVILSAAAQPLSIAESVFLCDAYCGAAMIDTSLTSLRQTIDALHTEEVETDDQSSSRDDRLPLKSFWKGLPPAVISLATEHSSIRLNGPGANSKPEDSARRAIPSDTRSEWNRTDALSIELPAAMSHITSEYIGISLHRTENQRRAARHECEKRMSLNAHLEHSPLTNLFNPLAEGKWDATSKSNAFYKPGAGLRQSMTSVGTNLQRHDSVYRVRIGALVDQPAIAILLSVDDHLQSSSIHSVLKQSHTAPRRTLSRHPIARVGGSEVDVILHFAASESRSEMPLIDKRPCSGEARVLVQELHANLAQPKAISCVSDVLTLGAHPSKQPRLSKANKVVRDEEPRPLALVTPSNISIFCSVETTHIRLAGSDPKNQPAVNRGVSLLISRLQLSAACVTEMSTAYFVSNHTYRFNLPVDVTSQATSALIDPKQGNNAVALMLCSAGTVQLTPLANAAIEETDENMDSSPHPQSPDEAVEGNWEYRRKGYFEFLAANSDTQAAKNALSVSHLSASIAVRSRKPNNALDQSSASQVGPNVGALSPDDIECRVTIPPLTLAVDAFTIYCVLIAVSVCRRLTGKKEGSLAPKKVRHHMPRPVPKVAIYVSVQDLFTYLTLPHHTRLFLHARRLELAKEGKNQLTAQVESLMGAVPSPLVSRQWENLLHLQDWTIRIRPSTASSHNISVDVQGASGRLRIPFKYPLSHVIDNASTLVKAVKQMVYQFVRGKYGSTLEPKPEGPKQIPPISVRVRLFLFEAQDDPFETKLNIIRRAGQTEQKSRHELEEKFERQMKAMREGELGNRPMRNIAQIRQQALSKLGAYQSASWIRRIRNATNEQMRREEALLRQMSGRVQFSQSGTPIDIAPSAKIKPLARLVMNDLSLSISKPSFDDVHDWLHDVGGLPKDTEFILLVPLHLSWSMKDARFHLRDYPLPLLNIPPCAPDQEESKSWHLETDFVIAEEFPQPGSVRRANCEIVEPRLNDPHRRPYSIAVPRSAMPTKMYALPELKINSRYTTRFGWSPCVQPAISDFTRVIDSITKPPPDPSEKIGFWDKIRLVAHGNMKIIFAGDVHFIMKGSRDPYALDGLAAGFLKSWSGNVKFTVNIANAERELLQITSDRYFLGVPDLSDYIDAAASGNVVPVVSSEDGRSIQSSQPYSDFGVHGFKRDTSFTKIMGKLVNGVRWGMGFRFERSCTDKDCQQPTKCKGAPFHRKCRFFDFRNHWEVKTRTREGAYRQDGELVDSYAGFRSHFIHFSISLTSPVKGGEVIPASQASSTLHFSPLLMNHFQRWWQLFDSSMSLPTRQGKLFPSAMEPSKKFGRHCATIKYRFDLEPMFISHMYRQEDEQDWSAGRTTILGIKCKTDVLKIDLHQREEEFSIRRPEMNRTTTVKHKKFYLAEVHSANIDLRVLAGHFRESEKAECVHHSRGDREDDDAGYDNSHVEGDSSLSDADLEWVDIDDFIDLGPALPPQEPVVFLHRIMNAQSATYYRQPTLQEAAVIPDGQQEGCEVSRDQIKSPVATRRTKFGIEKSHSCLVGQAPKPLDIETSIAKDRLDWLKERLKGCQHGEKVYSLMENLRRARSPLKSDDEDVTATRKKPALARQDQVEARIETVAKVLEGLAQVKEERARGEGASMDSKSFQGIQLPLISSHLSDDFPNWSNRVIVHSPEVEINNDSRDILRKYYNSHRSRKAEAFQLAARAVRFIDDLARSQSKAAQSPKKQQRTSSQNTVNDELPSGRHKYVWAHQATRHSTGPLDEPGGLDPALDVDRDIPDEFVTKSSLLVILLRPQFLLQSQTDLSTRVIVTTLLTVLRTYAIEDPNIRDDPINSTLMHRSYVELKGLQAFHPQNLEESDVFVPMEVLADSGLQATEYDRIVPTTDVMLKYDKYNHLRISHRLRNSKLAEFNARSRTDEITVGVSRLGISANRQQFSALYAVVADLILHSDPSTREKSEKLQALLLVTDFSDVSKRKQAILDYQRNIRSRRDILQSVMYRLNRESPDARLEFFQFQREMLQESEALALQIEAIRQSQHSQLTSGPAQSSGTRANVLAHETTWYMNDDENRPFVKVGLRSTQFVWDNKADGLVRNQLIVDNAAAFNCLPDHVFPEIVAKYHVGPDSKLERSVDNAHKDAFLVAMWNVLPSVGGISIINRMEVHLHPVSLQIERSIGVQMMDYIAGDKSVQGGGFTFTGFGGGSNKKSKKSDPKEKDKPGKETKDNGRLRPPPDSRHSSQTQMSSLPSSSSIGSLAHSNRSSSSINLLRHQNSHDQLKPLAPLTLADPDNNYLPVEEMRERAKKFTAFGQFHISPTVICVSYRALGKSSLTNIYGLTVRLPPLAYHNRIASYREIMDLAKSDIKSCLFSQTGSLLSQLVTTARKPTNFARAQSTKLKKAGNNLTNLGRKYIAGTDYAEVKSTSPLKQTFDPNGVSSDSDLDSVPSRAATLPPVDVRTPEEPMQLEDKVKQLDEVRNSTTPLSSAPHSDESDDSAVFDSSFASATSDQHANTSNGRSTPATSHASFGKHGREASGRSDGGVAFDERHTSAKMQGANNKASPLGLKQSHVNADGASDESLSESDASDASDAPSVLRPQDERRAEKRRLKAERHAQDPDHLVHHQHNGLRSLKEAFGNLTHSPKRKRRDETELLERSKEEMLLGQTADAIDK